MVATLSSELSNVHLKVGFGFTLLLPPIPPHGSLKE